MFRKIVPAAVVTLFAVPAIADTRLQYVDDQSGAQQTAIIIKDGKVRMDNADSDGWTLFDRDTGILTTIDPGAQTYTVLDEATMKQLSGRVSAAMVEMKQQMEQMPPEQRAMMEKMMGGATGAGQKMLETKVERTGNMLKKAGYDCEQVFYSVGNLSRSEMCVVDVERIKMPADDRKSLDAMQERMRAFAESMSESLGADFAFDFDSMGGMPVYMKHGGEGPAEILKDVDHGGIDASLLRIPESYREEKLQAGE